MLASKQNIKECFSGQSISILSSLSSWDVSQMEYDVLNRLFLYICCVYLYVELIDLAHSLVQSVGDLGRGRVMVMSCTFQTTGDRKVLLAAIDALRQPTSEARDGVPLPPQPMCPALCHSPVSPGFYLVVALRTSSPRPPSISFPFGFCSC